MSKDKAARAKLLPIGQQYELFIAFECYVRAIEWVGKNEEKNLRKLLISRHDAGTISRWENFLCPVNMNMLTAELFALNVSLGDVIQANVLEVKKSALARTMGRCGHVLNGWKPDECTASHVDMMVLHIGSVVKLGRTLRKLGIPGRRQAVFEDVCRNHPPAKSGGVDRWFGDVNRWSRYFATCVIPLRESFPFYASEVERYALIGVNTNE